MQGVTIPLNAAKDLLDIIRHLDGCPLCGSRSHKNNCPAEAVRVALRRRESKREARGRTYDKSLTGL